MILTRLVEMTAELADDAVARRESILEPRGGRAEVTRIGEAVRADRPAVGQPEMAAECLGDVAARLRVCSSTRNTTPRGITAMCPGRARAAELGRERQRADARE